MNAAEAPDYLLPPLIQSSKSTRWARFLTKRKRANQPLAFKVDIPFEVSAVKGAAPLSDCASIKTVTLLCVWLQVVDGVQKGICDARHTKLFDSERLASNYAAEYCRQHTNYKVRTLKEAYNDPRWMHLKRWRAQVS